MKCDKCRTVLRRNYYNNYKFSIDLYQPTSRTPYPHSHLDLEITSFIDSNKGDKCCSTFSLYLDKGMGKADDFGDGEKILCEEIPINQLERLYHFLDLIINKAHTIK
tara:strand:+ start:225 stop:545 length:321 start_codon:yes stop_codon:yes gene_type:complete